MENINLFRFILNTPEDNHGHMMDWWFDIFGIDAGLYMFLGMILMLSLGLIFAVFIYRDAIKRPHMNAELWMIIIILFNIVGIILYFLVRDTPSTNIYNTHNEVQVQ
ncbi:MAG: PLDc N-terminal domain-containing protein [Promethearchaeota archaeon]